MASEIQSRCSQERGALESIRFNQPRRFPNFGSITINVPCTQEGVSIQMNERWDQLLTDGGNWYDYANAQAQQTEPVLEYEERDFDAASSTGGAGEDSGLDEVQSKASVDSETTTSPHCGEPSLAEVCAVLFRATPNEVPLSVLTELRCMIQAKDFNFSGIMRTPQNGSFH